MRLSLSGTNEVATGSSYARENGATAVCALEIFRMCALKNNNTIEDSEWLHEVLQ